MHVKWEISKEHASSKYYIIPVDSSAYLFYYESKNNLEPELQKNAFWGWKLSVFSKTDFKE